jgi:hypothetical protein
LRLKDKKYNKQKDKSMKKMMICGLASMLLLFTSCVDLRMSNTLKPSDTVAEKEMKMEPFDKVELDAMGHVKIVQSQDNDYRVVLSAPDNYLDLFTFKVNDGELEMGLSDMAKNLETAHVNATIYTPRLVKVDNEGLCKLHVDSLRTKLLKVENSGVGAMSLHGLKVDKISVDCSGVGGIKLSGVAAWANLDCSGVGSIDAKALKARRVQGEVSGVGGIECYASDSLKATVSGVGAFRYAGKPSKKILDESGIGKISEL